MAWIESHDNLGQHPKVYALASALNADVIAAVGVLHLLWHFTLKFAWRDGDLSKFDPVAVAQGVCWTKDPVVLIRALQRTGWLDKMVVHDWLDYAGKIVRDRLYNEGKRRNTPTNADIHRKVTATNPTNLTNLTNQPTRERVLFHKPSAEEVRGYAAGIGYRIDAQAFVDHYESNGWKVGKNPMKDWKATVRNWRRHHAEFSGNGHAPAYVPPPKPREPEPELSDAERAEAVQVFGSIKTLLKPKEVPK